MCLNTQTYKYKHIKLDEKINWIRLISTVKVLASVISQVN